MPVRKDDGQNLFGAWLDQLEEADAGEEKSERTRTPAVIDNTDPNRHVVERQTRLYLDHKPEVLEDFKDKVAAKEWPGYKVLSDGRSGPAPFRNKTEMEMYCRNYGFEVPK